MTSIAVAKFSLVVNAGCPGNTSRDLLERLDRDVLIHNPTLVVMKVGTNDALNSGSLIPPIEFSRNIIELISKITKTSKLVLVSTIPYHAEMHGSRHDPMAFGSLSAKIRFESILCDLRKIASERRLPFIDLHAIYTACGGANDEPDCLLRNPSNSGVIDGVHPTKTGYSVIATSIFSVICALHLDASRTVCFGDSITFGNQRNPDGSPTDDSYPSQLSRMLSHRNETARSGDH